MKWERCAKAGDPARPGWMAFARVGLRSATASAQALRQTGGLGVRWKASAGPALQLDYSVAPLGSPGLVLDATVDGRW